jgi:hypothetical protein
VVEVGCRDGALARVGGAGGGATWVARDWEMMRELVVCCSAGDPE